VTARRWVLVVAAAFVALVVWVLVPPSERPFYDYVAERRAAGLATTRDEVRGPMPPPDRNGAVALEEAWDAAERDYGPNASWDANWLWLVVSNGELPDSCSAEDLAALSASAVRLRPCFDAFLAAADRPRLVHPVTFDADGFRDGARGMALRNAAWRLAIAAVGEPDPARRLAACRALLLLASRIETLTWPDWISCIRIRGCGVAALRLGIESGVVDPVTARAACDPLLAVSAYDAFRRAGHGAAVEMIESYRAMIEGRATSTMMKCSFGERFHHRVEAIRMRASGDFDPPDVDFEPGVARHVVAVCRAWDVLAEAPDLLALATADAIPVVDPSGTLRESSAADGVVRTAQLALDTESVARVARVALAAAEHRATHGDFPASLDELRPMFPDGVPLDAFTNAPLVYERTATGVRIASAGHVAGGSPFFGQEPRERILVWDLKR